MYECYASLCSSSTHIVHRHSCQLDRFRTCRRVLNRCDFQWFMMVEYSHGMYVRLYLHVPEFVSLCCVRIHIHVPSSTCAFERKSKLCLLWVAYWWMGCGVFMCPPFRILLRIFNIRTKQTMIVGIIEWQRKRSYSLLFTCIHLIRFNI